MRWYAERPGRAARQVVADVVALAWAVAAVLVGTAVHGGIVGLTGPARTLAEAGGQIEGTFAGAARTASDVPFVGDDLARAFDPGAAAGAGLARAGQDYADAVATLAVTASVLVPIVLLLPVLLGWLPLRLRYARRAAAATAARFEAPDLLALRALTRAPVRRVRAVDPDPVGAWRAGDPAAVRRLAALELASLGLRSPR